MAINKAQLTQLPIRTIATEQGSDAMRRREIAALVEFLNSSSHRETDVAAGLDRRLDLLVYELYRLNDAEIAEVERKFDDSDTATRRRAA